MSGYKLRKMMRLFIICVYMGRGNCPSSGLLLSGGVVRGELSGGVVRSPTRIPDCARQESGGVDQRTQKKSLMTAVAMCGPESGSGSLNLGLRFSAVSRKQQILL